jgi:hypothetical protein
VARSAALKTAMIAMSADYGARRVHAEVGRSRIETTANICIPSANRHMPPAPLLSIPRSHGHQRRVESLDISIASQNNGLFSIDVAGTEKEVSRELARMSIELTILNRKKSLITYTSERSGRGLPEGSPKRESTHIPATRTARAGRPP